MTGLLDCPDELLLKVAGLSDARSLQALALTSRKLQGIAEDVLYRHPDLTQDNNWQRFLSFGTTLLRWPHLAAHVQSLDLYFLDPECFFERYDQDYIIGLDDDIFDLAYELWRSLEIDQLVCNHWIESILNAKVLYFNILVLAAVPNLKTLRLKVLGDYDEGHVDILDRVFCGGSKNQLQAIPGLRSVEVLQLDSAHADWEWTQLPSLRELEIFGLKHMRGPMDIDHKSDVQALRTNMSTAALLDPASGIYPVPIPSMVAFGSLKKLCITLSNGVKLSTLQGVPFTGLVLDMQRRGHFDHLISRISPASSTLEVLDVRYDKYSDIKGMEYQHPIQNLQHFTRLKHLGLPADALGPSLDSKIPPLCQVLPSSLEKLSIYDPLLPNLARLNDITYAKHCLPELQQINICQRERSERKIPWVAVTYPYRLMLEGVGVKVRYFDGPNLLKC